MVDIEGIAKALVQEIKKEIIRMKLVDRGNYLRSIKYKINGNKILLYSTLEYAAALEYGTYDFGRLTRDKFPKTASGALALKKKDMAPEARKGLPKGMVAFSAFRRVLYNKKLVDEIIASNIV